MPRTLEGDRQRNRIIRAGLQDIGTPPDPPDDAEWRLARDESDTSLRRHLEICYPEAFPLAWSPDHLRLIDDIERAAAVGLLKCLAMPRGSGKTSIVMRAGLWSLLTRRRRWCCIVSATEYAARNLLKGLKSEITYNARLGKLYARELHAMRSLDNEPKRCAGQKSKGEPTGVEWVADRIGFGNVDGVETSGAILTSTGITGSIRGQQSVDKTGVIQRPDIALIDDPQSAESARSEKQCIDRHAVMVGDILGLAGPSKTISAITTCTVIHEHDLASRLLDRKESPDWQGETCKMVYEWPDRSDLWEQYVTLRQSELIDGGTGEQATEFYRANRADMDKGARVAWPQRYGDRELSAIQHCYNLRARDEFAFMAEYQNAPISSAVGSPYELRSSELSKRGVDIPAGVMPPEAEVVTAFIDVQKSVLFYAVMAWSPTGRGHVVEYGTYPDQKRPYYTKNDLRHKLQDAPGVSGDADAIYHGLENLTANLLGKDYSRGDGIDFRIDKLAIDVGYQPTVIRRFCFESPDKGRFMPSRGQYVGANSVPWHKMQVGKRDRRGLHVRVQAPPSGTWGVRELLVDVNFWKSFVAERLLLPVGSPRAIVLHKGTAGQHQMIADHCCAEDPVRATSKTGAECIEWRTNPAKPNNDFFDCLTGCAVLASLSGMIQLGRVSTGLASRIKI